MKSVVQKIVWHKTASPRDQVFMLRLLDHYGNGTFEATISDLCHITKVKPGTAGITLRRLKKMGWIKWERQYGEGTHNLRFVTGCKYTVKIAA